MSQQIGREAARFDGDVRRAQAMAHALGAAVEADRTRDRARGAAVVKRLRRRATPTLLGTWVAYEPNAYGPDAPNVNRGLQGDEHGRFAVWGERLTGKLNMTAFENEPGKPWDEDDYYTLPDETGFDGMLEPYLDSGAMMTSYVTPIERGGKRVGVAAVDLSLHVARRAHQVASRCWTPATPSWRRTPASWSPTRGRRAGRASKTRRPDRRAASRFRPGRHPRRRQGRSLGPRRDGRPGQRQAGGPVLRAGEDQRLELRRGRAEGRGAGRRQQPAHDADPDRPARPARRRRRRAVHRLAPEPPGAPRWLEAAERIADGDLDVAVTARSEDEVGRMAGAFGAHGRLAEREGRDRRGDRRRRPHPRRRAALRARRARARLPLDDRAPARDGRRGLRHRRRRSPASSGTLAANSDEAGRAVGEIASAHRRGRRGRRAPGPRAGGRAAARRRGRRGRRPGAERAAGTVQAAEQARSDGPGGHRRGRHRHRGDGRRARRHPGGDRRDPRRSAPAASRSAASWRRSPASPSRPTCSRSTPRSRPPAPASRARASRSSPTRCASWPRSPRTRPARSPTLIAEIQAETARAVDVVEEGARRTDDGVATVARGQQRVRRDPRRHRRGRRPGRARSPR